MKYILSFVLALAASVLIDGLGSQAYACQHLTGPARTSCEEVSYQSYRNTSGTPITHYSDHCDYVLRRNGEPIITRVVPRGHEAGSPQARALPRLTWAGQNSAGTRFDSIGLTDSSGRHVHEMELCVDSSVWRRSLAEAGVTEAMIRSGEFYVAICGWNWSHHLPAERVIAAMHGQGSGGRYSVLSTSDTNQVVAEIRSHSY